MRSFTKFFGVALGLFFAFGVGAYAAEIELQARSIPDACEFIYRVEADFIISYSDAALPEGTKIQLSYGLKDAYGRNGNWVYPKTIEMNLIQPGKWELRMTHETMSTAKRELFRDLSFYFTLTLPDGSQLRDPTGDPMPHHFQSEFGRQFGEPCYADGRLSTPYRVREIRTVQ